MVHKKWTDGLMNALALVREAKTYATRLEEGEAKRNGLTRLQARPTVARKLGVAPGTLENLSRGRLKDPLRINGLLARLRGAVVRELGAEIQRLEHERHVLIQTGVDPRSLEMAAVDAGLATAKEALGLQDK